MGQQQSLQVQFKNILQEEVRAGSKVNKPKDLRNTLSLHVGGLPEKSFYDFDLIQFFTREGFKVISASVASDPNSSNKKSLQNRYVSFLYE